MLIFVFRFLSEVETALYVVVALVSSGLSSDGTLSNPMAHLAQLHPAQAFVCQIT